uniref:DUF4326 domain-containing protein n=1 Tax=viral metagenome TaxID=1070528 RepID=A0A6M3L1R8_9ZZZZ
MSNQDGGPAVVVNLRREPYDVYIGRPSKWGNPFIVGEDGDRAICVEKYTEWIKANTDLLDSLDELRGKRLGCYCKPKACHGDVLVTMLAERSKG